MALQPNRKYLSGSEKRKLKKEKEKSIKQLPSVAAFFQNSSVEQIQSDKPDDLSDSSKVSISALPDAKNGSTVVNESVLDFHNVNSDDELLDEDADHGDILKNTSNTTTLAKNAKKEVTVESVHTLESIPGINLPSSSQSTAILTEEENNLLHQKLHSHSSENSFENLTISDETYEDVQKDPALWPSKLFQNSNERNKFLQKGSSYFQNKNSDFKKTSMRQCGDQRRYCSPKFFLKILKNGETCERQWLMFSESSGSLFCFACKLFSRNCESPFVEGGFSNWKKGEEIISSHEKSKEHHNCMVEHIAYITENTRIDKSMIKSHEVEVQYWIKVLKRVVSVVRFLSEKGLAFRGTDEKIGSLNNGNFLGIIELIAEYDTFLADHIARYANKGRGNVSYLSKTIFEELIEAMAKKVTQVIIDEVKKAKYWGLVLDSTPDVSHADQLSVVFRYYLNNQVHERFFSFLQIKSHKGRSMADDVLDLLKNHDIKIMNCRAQTYDNAPNMSGKYIGLQACICQENALAVFVPCAGHSLNLVGECSVEICIVAINFFGALQQLYVFFTVSTSRWGILSEENSNVKSLSITRWSRRSDATKSLKKNFTGIHNALTKIANDENQKGEVRNEAFALINHITKLENAFMTVFWDCILNRFESTSQYLQKVDVDLISASEMLSSLVDFVKGLRDNFDDFEAKAKGLSIHVKQEYTDSGKRKISRKLADGSVDRSTLSGSEKFRIETYYVIIDKLVIELETRSKAYERIAQLFAFLLHLLDIEEKYLEEKVTDLVKFYENDLDESLFSEFKQFIPLLRKQPKGTFSSQVKEEDKINDKILNPLKVLNWLVAHNMVEVFPNIYVAYRLLLTIPIANCETERSFSVLKRIKNLYRSTMLNDRLSALARLSIEKELLRSIDFDDIISEFAQKKARKKM